jgi:hypothetical protein
MGEANGPIVLQEEPPCCGNCPHARHVKSPSQIGHTIYACFRFPPQIVAIPTPHGPQFQNMYPSLGRDDTCDEHPRRKAELNKPKIVT